MSDHGVAVLTGKRLIEWLQIPKNLGALPKFLQKQLALGFQMSETMLLADAPASIQGCLDRDRAWVDAYEQFIRESANDETLPTTLAVADLAVAETKYAEEMWNRNYTKAASHLQRTLEIAGNTSVNTVCWHKLWLGYSLECAGDIETAQALYQQAHAGQRNIPAFNRQGDISGETQIPLQAAAVGRQFEHAGDGRVLVPRSLEHDLLYLNGTGTTNQTEEALRCLGQYLGFESSRPDNEHGTGPDVLWICQDKTALCVEAKTGKKSALVYKKDDFGQLADHVQWVRNHSEAKSIIPIIVGPELPVSVSANPAKGVKLSALERFHAIGETLKAAFRDIATNALPLTVGGVAACEFEKRGLLWPELTKLLNLIEMRDLKED